MVNKYFQDALLNLRPDTPNWFVFPKVDSGERMTYENITVCIEGVTKPTEEEVNTEIARLEALEYKDDRQLAYPSIGEQLDMQYWDAVNGTTTWKDAIAQVKTDNPKPE